MKKVIIKLIRSYQYFSKDIGGYNAIPLLFRSGCRYYPTCSDYMIESINKLGVWRGLAGGFVRILKCNPLITKY